MSEKIFPPTKKRLQEARKKGEVPRSNELASALFLCGALILMTLFSSWLKKGACLSLTSVFDYDDPLLALKAAISPLLFPSVVLLSSLFLWAFVVHYVQVGWLCVPINWHFSLKVPRYRLFYPWLKLVVLLTIGIFCLFIWQIRHFFFVALILCLVYLVLGIMDYFFERWRFMRVQRMSREEILEEKKR